ncbi:hypothetical protein OG481_02265 [Streptomyces longwoodensis]|uniref:hypothetical protein n=1 Tax=Streptomyces longwoodensis TaxID=68231 RepID=UPI002DD9FFFE|nr:hypothetical protein [Streptomyces longwoodensis]WRY87418.1 hypothetical protein OG481_02265 [Streptomyces longwoodensis]
MTGPEHYSEGERFLAGTDIPADPEQGLEAHHVGPSQMDLLEAQTHFLAALTAITAEDKFPLSVAWQKAVGW